MSGSGGRSYEGLGPCLVAPDYLLCERSATIAVIFSEPIAEESDRITLHFPSDSGTRRSIYSTLEVTSRRMGRQTIIFETPAYSANHGVVEVLPTLHLASGDVKLAPIKLTIRHPLRSIMEMCMELSASKAVLPVLLSLIFHCDSDGGQFKDSHTDRILSTLVGSLPAGSSTDIGDILMPNKKWKRASLVDFAREFGLQEMEKQASHLKSQKPKTLREKLRIPSLSKEGSGPFSRAHTMSSVPSLKPDMVDRPTSAMNISPTYTASMSVTQQLSVSEIKKTSQLDEDMIALAEEVDFMCDVVEDYHPVVTGRIQLFVGEAVHVVSRLPSGVWFGTCGDKTGYFPSKCVRRVRKKAQIQNAQSHDCSHSTYMYTRTEDAERHGCRNPIQVGLKLTSSPAIGLMPFQQSKRLSHSEPQLDESSSTPYLSTEQPMALHKTSSQSFIEQTKTDRGAPSATDEDSDQPSPTQDIDATEMDPSLDEEYMVMRSQSVDDDYVEVQLSNTPYENFTLPVSTVSTHTDGQVKAIQSEYIDIDQLESEYQQVAFTAQGSCNPAMETCNNSTYEEI